MADWDAFYIGLAEKVSEASKDPSTKVGAYISDKLNRPVSHGMNGFPRGVSDDPALYLNRDEKLRRTIHAELNAILFARRDLDGCTIYSTHFPCARCASNIIQVGIKRVVCYRPAGEFSDRWKEDIASAAMMFSQAGVEVIFVEKTLP